MATVNKLVPPFDVEKVLEYACRTGNEHVKKSIDLIVECMKEVNFDREQFCVSFNGGKDCTALLHLVYSVYAKNVKLDSSNVAINCLTIEMPDTFDELKQFVNSSIVWYNLHLLKVDGPDFKKALNLVKNDKKGQHFRFIYMGTRSSDTRASHLKPIQDTDAGWPSFTRVFPLLHWTYHQVWSFLRENNVPYCSLYDIGYTSLGQVSNTSRNPKLRLVSSTGEERYMPAYMLEDGDEERTPRQ
ncbi:FAD synthase-like isoform X2 [Leptotrombidium deliense]|uniref:FAD synthase n=1 Tax=Leptotrombidium deliense TaxID=299467 RepID=A0A443SS83_9ACAR|nr:FAD synthase-like isoform X2 [Leptotrombidium deliense]